MTQQTTTYTTTGFLKPDVPGAPNAAKRETRQDAELRDAKAMIEKLKASNVTLSGNATRLATELTALKTRIASQSVRLQDLLAENERLKLKQGETIDKHVNGVGHNLAALSRENAERFAKMEKASRENAAKELGGLNKVYANLGKKPK